MAKKGKRSAAGSSIGVEVKRFFASLDHTSRLMLVAAIILVAVLLLCVLFSRSSTSGTLPHRVQAHMPHWVDIQLITPNGYSRPEIELEQVNAIVIHYVGNPNTSAQANRNYFNGLAITGETSASSNFVVGLEGEVIQCVPVYEVAYCTGPRNFDTISIEVCHPDESGKFNDATMESLVKLTAWLCREFHLDADDIIRHYDVTGKLCPMYYVENEDAWEALKQAVREQI